MDLYLESDAELREHARQITQNESLMQQTLANIASGLDGNEQQVAAANRVARYLFAAALEKEDATSWEIETKSPYAALQVLISKTEPAHPLSAFSGTINAVENTATGVAGSIANPLSAMSGAVNALKNASQHSLGENLNAIIATQEQRNQLADILRIEDSRKRVEAFTQFHVEDFASKAMLVSGGIGGGKTLLRQSADIVKEAGKHIPSGGAGAVVTPEGFKVPASVVAADSAIPNRGAVPLAVGAMAMAGESGNGSHSAVNPTDSATAPVTTPANSDSQRKGSLKPEEVEGTPTEVVNAARQYLEYIEKHPDAQVNTRHSVVKLSDQSELDAGLKFSANTIEWHKSNYLRTLAVAYKNSDEVTAQRLDAFRNVVKEKELLIAIQAPADATVNYDLPRYVDPENPRMKLAEIRHPDGRLQFVRYEDSGDFYTPNLGYLKSKSYDNFSKEMGYLATWGGNGRLIAEPVMQSEINAVVDKLILNDPAQAAEFEQRLMRSFKPLAAGEDKVSSAADYLEHPEARTIVNNHMQARLDEQGVPNQADAERQIG